MEQWRWSPLAVQKHARSEILSLEGAKFLSRERKYCKWALRLESNYVEMGGILRRQWKQPEGKKKARYEKHNYDSLWGMVSHAAGETVALSLQTKSSLPVVSELGVSCYSLTNFRVVLSLVCPKPCQSTYGPWTKQHWHHPGAF